MTKTTTIFVFVSN